MNQRKFWDEAALSANLRNEWLCDKNVSDKQCLDQILPHVTGSRILDLGCGPGRLKFSYGVDISPRMLALAKVGRYKLTDGHSIPYPNDYFDSVFSVFMFQHIDSQNKLEYVKEVHRVLKPEGVFRFQFVNRAEAGPMSFPVKNKVMTDMLEQVGFTINSISTEIYKEWTWITATK